MILVLSLIVAPVCYSQERTLRKELRKEYKEKLRELKKGKWEIFGSARSADVTLLKFYEKLNSGNFEVVMGTSSSFRSKNIGYQNAQFNAATRYAAEAMSYIKGRAVSDLHVDGTNGNEEFDKFYQAYERNVKAEIKGDLQDGYSIIRQNADGTYEMNSYFIVDIASASKARLQAMENAAKESSLAQEYAKKISDFINEGENIEVK